MNPLVFILDGHPHAFIPLSAARTALGLPSDFGVARFEPKDTFGLGSLDHSGAALPALHAAVLAATAAAGDPLAWAAQVTAAFTDALRQNNAAIGLRESEITFAADSLSDVLRAWAYTLIRARLTHTAPPPFAIVYHEWLMGTIRRSSTRHRFEHKHQVWNVQTVTHAYGRFGLIMEAVIVPGDTGRILRIYDPALACPAEGFMTRLLEAVIAAAPT